MDKNINFPTSLELIPDENLETFAAISLNPNFQWAKVIVTDDFPNLNKQRIPVEEFANIIRTGINAPIKMARGKISEGHTEGFGNPIGVISQLTQETNKVIALAALWKKERADDIASLKDMYLKGMPPNVSWEIGYSASELNDSIETLRGVCLNGLCIVGLPAYSGRTSFVAMSSVGKENNMEELEQLKIKITELETTLAAKETELASLRTYKETVENEKEAAKKLTKVREKFIAAGIEKEETFFEENREKLLELDESMLDFMIQEMVAFSSKTTSASKTKIPLVSNTENLDLTDPKALAQALRELRAKK